MITEILIILGVSCLGGILGGWIAWKVAKKD
jgi:hypothetical protein